MSFKKHIPASKFPMPAFLRASGASRAWGVLAVFLPLSLGGCFLRSNTVVERFNGEFLCAKDQIKVHVPDKNQPTYFRAEGCNRRAHYRCTGDYGEFCERIGNPETIHPENGAGDTPPSGTDRAKEPSTQSP